MQNYQDFLMGDPSNSGQSLFSMEACPNVPDEAFNLFHSIDRELFARLVRDLGLDPAESVQVMALWMWLERAGTNLNLIERMLSLPLPLLNELADETAWCLKCVESDMVRTGHGSLKRFEIALLPKMLGNPAVGLWFFHENRIAVLQGVNKIIKTVCVRAFYDILLEARRGSTAATAYQPASAGEGGVAAPFAYRPYPNVPVVSFLGSGLVQNPSTQPLAPPVAEPRGIPLHNPSTQPLPLPVAEPRGIPLHAVAEGSVPGYDLGVHRQFLSNELAEKMAGRHLSGEAGKDIAAAEVGADERTIFLTFSKGYPIKEDEIRDFFTRKFGDFIEDLIMQEVRDEEQALYARMVVRSHSVGVIEEIVGGTKAKYSINCKHVWARKYVKKQVKSPPRERVCPR